MKMWDCGVVRLYQFSCHSSSIRPGIHAGLGVRHVSRLAPFTWLTRRSAWRGSLVNGANRWREILHGPGMNALSLPTYLHDATIGLLHALVRRSR